MQVQYNRRPEDNRRPAEVVREKLVKRLENSGLRKSFKNVPIKEYSELQATETELEPEVEGFCTTHPAVIRD